MLMEESTQFEYAAYRAEEVSKCQQTQEELTRIEDLHKSPLEVPLVSLLTLTIIGAVLVSYFADFRREADKK